MTQRCINGDIGAGRGDVLCGERVPIVIDFAFASCSPKDAIYRRGALGEDGRDEEGGPGGNFCDGDAYKLTIP